MSSSRASLGLLSLAITAALTVVPLQGQTHAPGSTQDVVTYHGDNLRTGWFSAETHLNAGNVNATSFGLLQTVTLDGRVDAEPLVVLQETIQNKGVHDVVYIATEDNTLYAIDANSGAILWQRHFGTPVPDSYKEGDDNVYPEMGVLSTPVIDRNAGTIYVVADTFNGKTDTFRLHAISLHSGKELRNPADISYSEQLANGTWWKFNSKYHLQRPGLLEVGDTIYVAFGSNGDLSPEQARGMILRYDANTLKQLTGQITNRRHEKTLPFYLSSIWQSGYGPAADQSGDIFFSTGNSDPNRPSYSKMFNRPDSVIHLSSDLSTLLDSFTTYDYFTLDTNDMDVGSGGMILLPDQPGSVPHLAVAGGKDGRAFLLNRDNLGGYTQGGPDKVLQTVKMGECWCGPAYFVGSDGVSRVVTGGGGSHGVTTWTLSTNPTPQLTFEATTGNTPVWGLPDNGGVMPVVSSNGTVAGTAILWFVQRPATSSDQNPGTPVTLWAFDPSSNLTQALVSIPAGTWTHASNSNANIVPTVSNGKVYVASNLQLQIFGLLSSKPEAARKAAPHPFTPSTPETIQCPSEAALPAFGGDPAMIHEFFGTVCGVSGSELRMALRGNRTLKVDTTVAFEQHRPILLTSGRPVHVRASIDGKGVVRAQKISVAHAISKMTPPDR
jgi:hypothetical protein